MVKREGMVDYHAYIRINDIGVRLKKGYLQLQIDLSNLSARPIREASFSLSARGSDGKKLRLEGEERLLFTLKDLRLEPAMRMVQGYRCMVDGAPEGIEIEPEQVVFASGEIGEKQKPHKKIYFYRALDPDKARDRELHGCLLKYSDKAVCFAEKRNDGWLCTCGRLNRNRDNTCPECLSDRKELFFYCTKEKIREELRRDRNGTFSLKPSRISAIINNHISRRKP